MLKVGEKVFPTEEHSDCLSKSKQSAIKTYICVTLYKLSSLCLEYMCICIYSFACNNNEKRGNKFAREKGGISGKVWREEREGGKRCDWNIISKFKKMEK